MSGIRTTGRASTRRSVIAVGAAVTLAAGVLTATTSLASTAPSETLRIATVSNRADLVSGGDVLVRVSTPHGVRPSAVRLTLNGQDITSAFRNSSDGHGLGRVTGLKLGANNLVATAGGYGARLTVTNHPLGGPVFNGPQIQPWTCSNGSKNAKCYSKPSYSYSYVDTTGRAQSYDPKSPPPSSQIANTTTTDGVTVPF